MAKFFGVVGYAKTEETNPGVWEEFLEERPYTGDVLKNNRRWENGENLNDEFNINNSFSIVADEFAFENIFAIRYVTWMGAKWKVTNVEVQRPRLLLTVGGVYNGQQD